MPCAAKLSELAAEPCAITELGVYCPELTNLDFLVNYPQLAHLRLCGLPRLTNLDGLQYVPQLTRLDLWKLPQLPNLDGLKYVPQLTRLDLWELPETTNLEGLQSTPHLTELDLWELPPLIEIPRLPMLERLATDEPIISKGVVIPFIDSLAHYQRIWSQAKRACP